MVFLQPEYFKLFFLLVLLAPLWLFYFSANATPANAWAPPAVRKISPPLFVARRDALSADQSGIGSPGARAGPPSTHTGKTGRPA